MGVRLGDLRCIRISSMAKQAGATSLRRTVSTEDRTSTSWGREGKNIAARGVESGLKSEFAQLLTDSLDTGRKPSSLSL